MPRFDLSFVIVCAIHHGFEGLYAETGKERAFAGRSRLQPESICFLRALHAVACVWNSFYCSWSELGFLCEACGW
jgi:hypothetical protein